MDFMIGVPYVFRTFNCWDYVAKVRADNGIKTKLFRPRNKESAFKMIKSEMQKIGHGLTKVDVAEDFDIIITRKGEVYHCGLYYNGEVVHCSRQLRQVVKESFTDFIKPYEEHTLWR